jgi:hypothetical protein
VVREAAGMRELIRACLAAQDFLLQFPVRLLPTVQEALVDRITLRQRRSTVQRILGMAVMHREEIVPVEARQAARVS